MLEEALKYANMGWKVFPLLPKKKQPYTKKGFYEATTDYNAIKAWWKKWPDANIGIFLDGLCVIDIDVHDKGKNGYASLTEFDIPQTLAVNTPTGGRHYYFKIPQGMTVSRKTNYRPGIDRLTNGYVLAPSSIHPNGKPYTWMDGCSPSEIIIADLPEEFVKDKVRQHIPWETKPKVEIDNKVLEQRARLYLEKCEPAIQGCGGHNALLYAASALVNGFDMDDATATHLLWNIYNPMCVPSWDRGNPADVKDFERKVQQARLGCDRQPGWLIGDDIGLMSGGDPLGAQSQSNILKQIASEVKKEIKADSKKDKPKFLAKNHKTNPPPQFVFDNMPKLLAEIKEYMDKTAIVPQPWLNLGAAISLVSLITGKKWKYRGQRTNTFIISSAPSSSGKENGRKAIKKILAKAGLLKLLGGETVTSDKAILRVINDNGGRVLYPWDECSHFFMANKDKNSGTHNKLIVPTLMSLYSSADGVYMGKDYADGNNDVPHLNNPHCCIYGTTTPAMLFKAFGSDDAESGDMARMLFFQSFDEPEPRFNFCTDDPSDELCEKIKEVADILVVSAEEVKGLIENVMGVGDQCKEFEATKEAEDLLKEYQLKMHYIKVDEHEGAIKAIIGKCFELMVRLTIISAVSNDHEVIQKVDAQWACELVEYLVMECVGMSKKNLDKDDTQAKCEAVVKYIESCNTWVSHTEILQNVRAVKKTQDLKQLIPDLQDKYSIEVEHDGKFKKIRYRIAKE